MKTIAIALATMLLAGTGFALPPAAFVFIEKIEGKVLEIPKLDKGHLVAVRLQVTFTSAPDKTKKLYSTIRRKTRYRIKDLKRPRKDEVILILPYGKTLPKGTKIGDKLRVLGYAVRGSDRGMSPSHTSTEFRSIERNPKG